jgi:hypothetical protein
MKEGSLLALFVLLRFPNHGILFVLLVWLESFQWVGVNQDGLVMFRHTMQELLNMQQICQKLYQNQN